jgi:hypothetical protein
MNANRRKGHLDRPGKQDGHEEEAKLVGRDDHQQTCAEQRAEDRAQGDQARDLGQDRAAH